MSYWPKTCLVYTRMQVVVSCMLLVLYVLVPDIYHLTMQQLAVAVIAQHWTKRVLTFIKSYSIREGFPPFFPWLVFSNNVTRNVLSLGVSKVDIISLGVSKFLVMPIHNQYTFACRYIHVHAHVCAKGVYTVMIVFTKL